VEQLAEICVRRAAFELLRPALCGVESIDETLADIATAGHDAFSSAAPIGLARVLAQLIEQPIARPVAVTNREFRGVANGDDLKVGRCQQIRHLAQTLGTAPYIGKGDFVAGGHNARPTKYVSRNDSKGSRDGSRS